MHLEYGINIAFRGTARPTALTYIYLYIYLQLNEKKIIK